MYVEGDPCGDVGMGWKGKGSGWGRRRERLLVVARILRKIDEVNTIRGYYLIYLCK